MTPIILKVSKEYEDYSGNSAFANIDSMSFHDFISAYFREGFGCLVIMGDPSDTCNFVLFYLLGYVFSLFVL